MSLNYNILLFMNSIYILENCYTNAQPVSGNYVRSFGNYFKNNFLKLSKQDKLEKILQRPNYINFLYKQLKGNHV